jgi:predicted Fe-Mo cluster-binding NifX family protein
MVSDAGFWEGFWGKGTQMRIAVACDGLMVAPQASRCEGYACYEVLYGTIQSCRNVPTMDGSTEENLALLKALEIDILIARHFTEDFALKLRQASIECVTSRPASPRAVVDAYLRFALLDEPEELLTSDDTDPQTPTKISA